MSTTESRMHADPEGGGSPDGCPDGGPDVTTTTDLLVSSPGDGQSDLQMVMDELAALRTEVAQLRAGNQPTIASAPTTEAAPAAMPAVSSRRRLLALAGGAAAAAVVAGTVGSSSPVAAANNSFMIFAGAANANTATASVAAVGTVLDYTLANSLTDANLFTVQEIGLNNSTYLAAVAGYAGTNAVTGVYGYTNKFNGNGLVGRATANTGPSGYAVWGLCDGSGYAVVGESTSGVDLFASGTGRLRLDSHLPVGPPLVGSFSKGEIITDATASVWFCYAGGEPGSWRKIAGATTAGALHLIEPVRVADTRKAGFGGVLSAGFNRVVNVVNGIDLNTGVVNATNVVPAGATGVVCNLTVVNAASYGYLGATPGNASSLKASNVNWVTGGPATVANGATVKLANDRQIKVWAGGGGSCNYLVDIQGYYL